MGCYTGLAPRFGNDYSAIRLRQNRTEITAAGLYFSLHRTRAKSAVKVRSVRMWYVALRCVAVPRIHITGCVTAGYALHCIEMPLGISMQCNAYGKAHPV